MSPLASPPSPPGTPVPVAASDEADRLRARLAALERYLDETQAIAGVGSFQWLVAEDRIEWSAEQLRIHGRDEATRPRDWAEFLACVHPEERDEAVAALERLLRDGRGESRYRVVRPDGEVRTVHTRTAVVRDAAGAPVRVVGTVQDVTHLAAVERELRDANGELERRVAERTAALEAANEALERDATALRRQALILETLTEAVVVTDAAGRITDWNAAAGRMFGRARADVLGRHAALVNPPDDAPWVTDAIAEGLAREGRWAGEVPFVRADGTTGVSEMVAVAQRDEADGRLIGCIGVHRDVTERKAAKAALQRREEHFRRLIEHAHDLIVIVDEDGIAHYGSPSVRRVLGYDPEALNGRSIVPLIHPGDAAYLLAWLRGLAAAPGVVHRAEYRFRHADGRWVYLEAVSTPAADDRPGSGHVMNVRDVTERREAEAALRASEEYFRTLIENAQDMVVVLDPVEARHLYQSPSVRRVLGYEPEELAAMNAFALIHPEDLERAMAELAHALATPGTTRHAVYRYRHKDGSWRELETFGRTLSPTSAEHGLVFNTRDVTERREAERALQASEEHFRRLIENGSDLLMISAPDLALTYVSPSAERLLGYTPEEMLAKTPADLVHPDDVATVVTLTREILAHPGTVRRIAWRIRHKDGSWRLIDAIGRTLDPHSAADGVVCNGRDVTEQRAAEEALQRSEEHFRALIEHSYDLVQVIAPTGQIAYTGPSVQRLLGYTPEEIAGMTIPDFMHPDDVPAAAELVARILANPGTSGSLEYRVRHKDGSWRWLEAWARTLSPTSAAEGLVANARDVTERREAQERLRASEEHFRRLIENGNDLLMICRPDGALTYVSPSMKRVWGYDPDWMLGKRPIDLLHPDDVPDVMATLAAAAAQPGTVHLVTFRARHADGSWRVTEVLNSTLDPMSADTGIMCNMRDITELRATQLALQESESRYRSLIDAAQDMITVIDAAGIVKFQSPSAERILGFTPEEMVGRDVLEFLHPDDVEMATRRLSKVVSAPGTVECVQYRSRCKDGSYRYLESTGRTILPDSAAAGAVGIVRDITDRIEAEEALRQAKSDAEQAREEAERANRAKSEFLSRMSHELRTPLNSILGFAQVLEDLELPAEYRSGVRHILNGGRHLLNLINEVLDLARIEADEQPMSLEPVRVSSVIREAVDMVRPIAEARGIRVMEVPHADGERYVRADRQRLVQVLLNLLSNAVKYNRPAGAVRIAAEAVAGGAAAGAAAGDAERVRVRVTDEGAGIAPERRDELFVPFARLGAEYTGVEGTGLGLALSQRLARAMGGALFLERTGADGSVFSVDLEPAADPLAAAPALGARIERRGGAHPPATLLYVEDNLANLSLVETILLPRPEWRLVPALQGRLGLELAAEHAPDLILLDLHLPDLPGREVLRQLRAEPRTAHTPVVVISADATPRTIEALLAEGAEAFLTKPLDVRAFLATVERLLARAPRAGQAATAPRPA